MVDLMGGVLVTHSLDVIDHGFQHRRRSLNLFVEQEVGFHDGQRVGGQHFGVAERSPQMAKSR